MTYTACSPVTRRFCIVTLAVVTLAVSAMSVEAGPRRARLSRDLSERLAARLDASTDVIVTGTDEQVNELATRYGVRVKKRLRNAAVFEVTGGQLRDLSEDADVATVSSDLRVHALATVTAEAIGADQAWRGATQGVRGVSGRGIGIAIIDTGVDLRHPYVRGLVALSLDFTGAPALRGRDENGHGTHIAGTDPGHRTERAHHQPEGDGCRRLRADERRYRSH